MPRDCTGTLAPNPTLKCEFVLDVQSPVLASGDPMTTPKKPTVRKSGHSKGRIQNTNSAPRVAAAPVAVSSMQKSMQTTMRSRRIKNSEFIDDLFPISTFAIQSYVINPGLAESFPWLSTQATNWQQYRFHSLRYRFVTRTGTSTIGSVILSPEYNSADNAPTSERQAMNTMDAVEDVVWKEVSTTLNVAAMFALGPRKQIRSSNIAGDTTVYDAGVMHACLAFVGAAPSNQSVGKLWVDYDVELFVPQTTTAIATRISTKMFTCFILPGTIPTVGDSWNIVNLSYDHVGFYLFTVNTLGAKTPSLSLNDFFDLPEGGYSFQLWISYQTWVNPSTVSESHIRFANISAGAPYTQVGNVSSTRHMPSSTGEGLQLVSDTVSMFGTFEVASLTAGLEFQRFQVQNQQPAGASSGGSVCTVNGGALMITLL
nr:MAG: coat protein [Narnaviridae sp.]